MQKPGEIDLAKGQRNQLMYISMFKDLCVLRIILVLASLIVVNLDSGVGVFGVGKVVPLPMWLLRPHSVGLLDLVRDVLANDMLLEIREHLGMGQHGVDVFHKCCLWVGRLVEGICHLVNCEFALIEQLLVVDGWKLHQVQIICIC